MVSSLLYGIGNEGISSSKVEEFLQAAMDKCDSHVEGAGGIKEVIKEWLTTSLMTMTDLAQVVNEAPMAPKDKVGSLICNFYLTFEKILKMLCLKINI